MASKTGKPLTTRVVRAGGGEALRLDQAELVVAAGPDRRARIELGPHAITIGSAADCDLVLHDPAVSARHARVAVDGGGFAIEDLGSRNGLLLGTWRIGRMLLVDRLRLRLGDTTLAVRALGGHRSVALAAPRAGGGLVAVSHEMRAVVASLERLARGDVAVLLQGETGTGKTAAARALHEASARAAGPFVVLDAAAVPPALLAAELCGVRRGAFTGADRDQPGALARARGGTLFIDEIGELAAEHQVALLRAVDRKAIAPVGGGPAQVHDARVVAATHRNLAEEVRAGRFRKDLFHRLSGATVHIPALRDRRDCMPALARGFAAELGVDVPPELAALFVSHDWPGNVRELRSAILRVAAGAAPLPTAPAAALAPPGGVPPSLHAAREAAKAAFERAYLDEALARAGGNLSRAAELASVSRQLMARLAARHRRR